MQLRHSWWWQLEQIYFNNGCKISIFAKSKGEYIDITSESDNDEDELKIL